MQRMLIGDSMRHLILALAFLAGLGAAGAAIAYVTTTPAHADTCGNPNC